MHDSRIDLETTVRRGGIVMVVMLMLILALDFVDDGEASTSKIEVHVK